MFNKLEFSLVCSAKATFYVKIIAWLQISLCVGISNKKNSTNQHLCRPGFRVKTAKIIIKGFLALNWGLLALVFHRCCSDDGCGSWHQSQITLRNTYSSHGNFSHKEGDVSFSVSESLACDRCSIQKSQSLFQVSFMKCLWLLYLLPLGEL